ncbi:hypothetical protein ABZ897_28895 [Nonomuraea sp. NPDC046802]|uniref:hypothetical protein n=1 Tax=Nonomuraea sp. NPDC046802 TaxID=3154919 RepID=UPI0033D7252B
MATLLTSAIDSLRIHQGSEFLVTEVKDGVPTGSPGPGEVLGTWTIPRIGPGPNGVDITTAAASLDSPIHVRYELWDAEPGPLPSWHRMWEGRLFLRTGRIGIAQHFAKEWDEYLEFDTGERDSTWSARVLNRLLSNTEEPDFSADIVEVDLYRIQLWPPETT